MAKMVNAEGLNPDICRFESGHAYQCRVAQWIERGVPNLHVAGSNPAATANLKMENKYGI